MILLCVRGGEVIFRYAPVDDEMSGLRGRCGSARAEADRHQLTCGRAACPLDTVQYECLLAGAAADLSRDGPTHAL